MKRVIRVFPVMLVALLMAFSVAPTLAAANEPAQPVKAIMLKSAKLWSAIPQTGAKKVNTKPEKVKGEKVKEEKAKAKNVKAKVVVALPKGKVVTVTGEDGDYYKVTYKNKRGYVEKAAVKALGVDNPLESAAKAVLKAKVTMYTLPSTLSQKACTINKKATVTCVAENGGFVKVKYKNKTGYIPAVCVVLPTL